MTSRDFAFWLQGFFEINEAAGSDHKGLTVEQTEMIQRHLNLVFKHEIEPSMNLNDEEKKIHDGNLVKDNDGVPAWNPMPYWTNPAHDWTFPSTPTSPYPQIYC